MNVGRSGWSALVVAAVIAGCGSSTSSTSTTASPSSVVASQPTLAPIASPPPASAGGGGTAAADIPTVADRNWTMATTHIEISGGRTLTIDGIGSAFSAAGFTSVNATDVAHSYNIGITISNDENSGIAVSAPDLITGGTFGKECQISITRNEPTELAGEFSCTNAEAADPKATQTFRVNIRGSFSAKP